MKPTGDQLQSRSAMVDAIAKIIDSWNQPDIAAEYVVAFLEDEQTHTCGHDTWCSGTWEYSYSGLRGYLK